jgi:hypothetical protein
MQFPGAQTGPRELAKAAGPRELRCLKSLSPQEKLEEPKCMDPQNRISAYTRLTELRVGARSHGNSLLREWWLDYKYGPLYRPLRHP